jgi:hypothetical protein
LGIEGPWWYAARIRIVNHTNMLGSGKAKRLRAASIALGIFLAVFPTALSQDTNVSGAWDISLETQQGTATPTMVLRQEGEKLTGTYKGRLGESKLEGTVKGRSIRFSVSLKFRDQPMTVSYDGTVENDSMKGKATFGDRGTGSWTAKRKS